MLKKLLYVVDALVLAAAGVGILLVLKAVEDFGMGLF